jgi:hypothetical protein
LTLNADVILAKMVIGCKAEAATFDAYSGAVPQPDIMQVGGCMDDALQGQCKDAGQLELTLNSDGMLAKKVIECKAEAATFDAYSGAVPQTDIMQAGGGMDDALRLQGKCKEQLESNLSSGGGLVTKGIDFKILDASSGAVPQFVQTAHTAVFLQRFYAAQSPAALSWTPMILEEFACHEHELVEQLRF